MKKKSKHLVRCRIIKAKAGCPRKLKKGTEYFIDSSHGAQTPSGMCARAFHTIYPLSSAIGMNKAFYWEKGKGWFDITCPDGQMVYRLSPVEERKRIPR